MDVRRHLYLEPVRLADLTVELAERFRTDGQLLVTHAEVGDRLPAAGAPGDEAGWACGEFADVVLQSFVDSGWRVERVERGGVTRTFYTLPLEAHFEEHHPHGRFLLSTEELVSMYVSNTVPRNTAGDPAPVPARESQYCIA